MTDDDIEFRANACPGFADLSEDDFDALCDIVEAHPFAPRPVLSTMPTTRPTMIRASQRLEAFLSATAQVEAAMALTITAPGRAFLAYVRAERGLAKKQLAEIAILLGQAKAKYHNALVQNLCDVIRETYGDPVLKDLLAQASARSNT